MIALGIVLAHLVGDYLIQSHWMATEKTRRWWPAIAHGITYTLPYALVTQSWAALIVISGTHMIIADNTIHLLINTTAVLWL